MIAGYSHKCGTVPGYPTFVIRQDINDWEDDKDELTN